MSMVLGLESFENGSSLDGRIVLGRPRDLYEPSMKGGEDALGHRKALSMKH